jgi:hypothetical protein
MPLTLRHAADRGTTDLGWLDARHTFAFGRYHDPDHTDFGPLRVINDDRIAPNAGFDTHPHRDMEIITLVLAGRLAHRDSMGSASAISAGDIQVMSAGSGVRHSEFNASDAEPVHLLQIWIEPSALGVEPRYAEATIDPAHWTDRFALLVRPMSDDPTTDADEGRPPQGPAIGIHQDAKLLAAELSPGATVPHRLAPGRRGWIHVATGAATVNGIDLTAGDGAAIEDETDLTIASSTGGLVLLFDLPTAAPCGE